MSGSYEDPPEAQDPPPDPEPEPAPEPTPETPSQPTQADMYLGQQGKMQQEAARAAEEERLAREELERNRAPTGRTLREQQAGEKRLADREAGAGKGAAEAKAGAAAVA